MKIILLGLAAMLGVGLAVSAPAPAQATSGMATMAITTATIPIIASTSGMGEAPLLPVLLLRLLSPASRLQLSLVT